MTSATFPPPTAIPTRPFSMAEASERGIRRSELRRAISEGDLRTPFRGVYVPSHLPDTQEVRAAALALVVNPHHVVCDRTAAWLYGIDTYAYVELTAPPRMEVCAFRGHTPTRRLGADARSRDLAAHDVHIVGDIHVTTPVRTALDLGCHLRRREAMAAMDAFARLHAVSPERLLQQLARFRGRRGVIQLRELISLIDARAESPRESWTRLAIADAGLPLPTSQLWIAADGIRKYRLDHGYEEARVSVEYDGWDFHLRTPEQLRDDESRRQWLRDHGWTIIVVRLGDFSGERLDAWLDQLREALMPAYTSRRF